jgi:hypothetical protein
MAQAELVSIAGRARFTGAPSKPSTTPVDAPIRVAHAEFLAVLAGHPPQLTPVDADPIELQDRANHLDAVPGGLAAYLAIILDDTVHSTPGGPDLCDAEAILAELGQTSAARC